MKALVSEGVVLIVGRNAVFPKRPNALPPFFPTGPTINFWPLDQGDTTALEYDWTLKSGNHFAYFYDMGNNAQDLLWQEIANNPWNFYPVGYGHGHVYNFSIRPNIVGKVLLEPGEP